MSVQQKAIRAIASVGVMSFAVNALAQPSDMQPQADSEAEGSAPSANEPRADPEATKPDVIPPEGEAGDETESVAPATDRAAELYDEATRLYARAEYRRAAARFLQADELVPSSEALLSAMASGRRAQAHLLVARAALRADSREAEDPKLAAQARAALAEAEAHLSRLHATCSPAPCTLFLNDQRLPPGNRHLLPGSYKLSASVGDAPSAQAKRVTEHFAAKAGAEYRFVLDLDERLNTTRPAALPSPEPLALGTSSPHDEREKRLLPSWTFYTGVGLTSALALVTTWSGLDALEKKDGLPRRDAPNYSAESGDVHSAARRTDWLLGASLLTGAATAAAGFWWVNWEGEPSLEVGTSANAEEGFLRLQGNFE